MMYQCKHCTCNFTTQTKYVLHYQLHRNQANIQFPCGFHDCPREFRSYSAFKSHVSRDHFRPEGMVDSERAVAIQIQDNLYLCAIDDCGETFPKYFDFIKHLKAHIKRHGNVGCPYQNCALKFNKISSFTSHLSRKHKSVDTKSLTLSTDHIHASAENVDAPTNEESQISIDNEIATEDSDSDMLGVETITEVKEQFLKSLACFYMKLQSKYLIPISTIQLVIKEFQEMHTMNQTLIKQSLIEKMKGLALSDEVISEILFTLLNSDEFTFCNEGPLKTNQRRTSFYKLNFGFVEPIQVPLGEDKHGSSKTPSYQYVSILESIKMLYQKFPEAFHFRLGTDRPRFEYTDVFDGKVYQKNRFFNTEEKSFQIILYQDAFEVVNPLGAAKKKYKLIGVYYTLANFKSHNRSNIDHMQLAILCTESYLKDFGAHAIFSKLVEELKVLESVGIDIGNGEYIRGTVFCILGDNLGSHMIGGFVESFSATYYCRYCCITSREFQDSDGTAVGYRRTIEDYKESVKIVEENNDIQNHKGVKSNSIFNTLKFYHVAMPGLPPCLGHDLFEGVVTYDMALIVKHLTGEEHYFTYDQLNRRIDSFEYKGTDALDRPCLVSCKSDKIGGAAIQNWVFVRLFPYFVGSFIENTDNNVWQLYLKLKVIVEIICSPVVSSGQIAYLKICIEEYLCDRKLLFPNTPLRPKHHFLNHYAEMMLYFGPLIHMWTIRFESKHSYFKQCVRKFHNYKHIAKTLAAKHQLLQAYYTSGNLFSPEINLDTGIPFIPENYNEGKVVVTRGPLFPPNSESSSPISSMSSTSSVGTCPSPITFEKHVNTDPNWPDKIQVSLDNLERDLKVPLQAGKRLVPDVRRNLVRLIVDRIREKTLHATKNQFATVAKNIVSKFRGSLEDRLEGTIIGSGFDSFLKQLIHRNENQNRQSSDKKVRFHTGDQEPVIGDQKRRKTDSYGCINFGPSASSEQLHFLEQIRRKMSEYVTQDVIDWKIVDEQLTETYTLQRKHINDAQGVRNLTIQWPYLFTERGINLHFKLLVGIDLKETISNAYVNKAPRLLKFFDSVEEHSGQSGENETSSDLMDNPIRFLPKSILSLMKCFSEAEDTLFLVVDENLTKEEIELLDCNGWPRLVCLGDSVLNAKKFMLIVDGVIVLSDLHSFLPAISSLFGLFYVLNIEYQDKSTATLEFIQRCLVGLNPDKGNKFSQGKKRKATAGGGVHQKVLRLINSLANFDWIGMD